MVTRKLRAIVVGMIAVVLSITTPCRAQNFSDFGSAIEDYFINWFPRVTQIQSEQPQWVTPLVTVTPRLEEEYRYDQFFQSMRDGVWTNNFGGSKGVELIPFQNTEVIIGVPGYLNRNMPKHSDGWADWPFLVKYRLLVRERRERQLHRHRLHGVHRSDRLERQWQWALALHVRRWRRARASATSTSNLRSAYVSQRRSGSARDAADVEYRLSVSGIKIFLAGVRDQLHLAVVRHGHGTQHALSDARATDRADTDS